MTTFDKAARKAAEAIERAKSNAPDEWFLIPITEMTEIITKHYADLAETFGLLCELAVETDRFFQFQQARRAAKALEAYSNNPPSEQAQRDFDEAFVGCAIQIRVLLNKPAIAALLKKG